MKRAGKRMLFIIFLCVLLTSLLPVSASANAAEPPSLVILVHNPPEDLTIELVNGSERQETAFRRIGWEGYYIVYHNFKADGIYKLRVTTQGARFDCQTSQPLNHYCSVFTLDLSARTLTPGTAPLHTLLTVSVRVALTLVIEGILFWLFGYRKNRSWRVFILVNLATQLVLTLLLRSGYTFSIKLYDLWLAEVPVFLIEMFAMPILIKEHSKRRAVLFAFLANTASLSAGSLLITVLPV